MTYRPPVLTYEAIRDEAEAFLAKYHRSLAIPTPIEEIVEFDLSMDVIPIPGLKDEIATDAFLASNLESIFVDEETMVHVPNRFYFSLAHEVGHWWLHDELYKVTEIESVAAWKEVYRSLGDDYRWFEFQANSFAGLVLVPPPSLKARFEVRVLEVEEAGMPRSVLFDHPQRSQLISRLARDFSVSELTMEIRLEKDGLIPSLEEM